MNWKDESLHTPAGLREQVLVTDLVDDAGLLELAETLRQQRA